MCTDVNGTSGIAQGDFKKYIAELETQSAFFAGPFSQVCMKCIGWQLRPTWRFDGPFAAPGGTAFPLLLVGATRDPVTPIAKGDLQRGFFSKASIPRSKIEKRTDAANHRSAHTLATRFPGSTILAVDIDGYSSFSGPSLCMAGYIRAYFQKGDMPPSGTVCEANEKSFLGVVKEAEGEEERRLLEVLRWISWYWNG
ncbi:MAG: hypothetical protein Q9216_001619 [Gyalolechia sp. 2 TL-2023]